VVRTVGIPRKVDHLGRIVVPVEFRRLLGIHEGDELEVTMDGDRVVLTRVEPACVFCEGIADLRSHRARWVCASCLGELTGGAAGDV
jgi:transcriptional pleiotropic regulator of transition state genes